MQTHLELDTHASEDHPSSASGHLEAIWLGRLTALQKPDGGVRGIVVWISKRVEAATTPFQHALKTKTRCENVAGILQTLTDLDPEATVMSFDGVGAHDLISHNATLEGLLRMEGGDPPLREMIPRQPIHMFVGR